MMCGECGHPFRDGEYVVYCSKRGERDKFELLHSLCVQKRHGYIHKCPKCKSEGKLKITYNAYPKGFPDSNWVRDMRTKWVDCDLCEGRGYTKTKKVPVTELVGYRDEV